MVTVQVRHHHHVHVFGAHAVGLEVLQEPAPGDVGRIGGPGAEAGVDEDRLSVGPDQVRAEVEPDLVRGRQMGLMGPPLVLRNGREEVAEVELQHAVRQRHDLDVPDQVVDPHLVAGDRVPDRGGRGGKGRVGEPLAKQRHAPRLGVEPHVKGRTGQKTHLLVLRLRGLDLDAGGQLEKQLARDRGLNGRARFTGRVSEAELAAITAPEK